MSILELFRIRSRSREILPEGTMITINRMMMPTMMQIRIFMSFHHICLRTRLAPRRKPCADVARLSVLSCRASRRSPRCEALFRLSCICRTVLSISCWSQTALLAIWSSLPRGRPPVRYSCQSPSIICRCRTAVPALATAESWADSLFEAHRCANRLPGRHRYRGCRGDRRAARGRPL